MESQPAWRQWCRMHRMPWRDNSNGLCGQACVKRMRHLSHRSGRTSEVRCIHEGQDVCDLSSIAQLHGSQEGGESGGRRVITLSGRCRFQSVSGEVDKAIGRATKAQPALQRSLSTIANGPRRSLKGINSQSGIPTSWKLRSGAATRTPTAARYAAPPRTAPQLLQAAPKPAATAR